MMDSESWILWDQIINKVSVKLKLFCYIFVTLLPLKKLTTTLQLSSTRHIIWRIIYVWNTKYWSSLCEVDHITNPHPWWPLIVINHDHTVPLSGLCYSFRSEREITWWMTWSDLHQTQRDASWYGFVLYDLTIVRASKRKHSVPYFTEKIH